MRYYDQRRRKQVNDTNKKIPKRVVPNTDFMMAKQSKQSKGEIKLR